MATVTNINTITWKPREVFHLQKVLQSSVIWFSNVLPQLSVYLQIPYLYMLLYKCPCFEPKVLIVRMHSIPFMASSSWSYVAPPLHRLTMYVCM